jgi:lysophospholipase L1-like esterase
VHAACEADGARLIVVALPMDVQVSAEEWKKYGAEPIDMEPTKILVRDLLEAAEAVGAKALDATPALAAAEPGAFLDKDIHMTAKGHRALAEALVPVIREAMAAR